MLTEIFDSYRNGILDSSRLISLSSISYLKELIWVISSSHVDSVINLGGTDSRVA